MTPAARHALESCEKLNSAKFRALLAELAALDVTCVKLRNDLIKARNAAYNITAVLTGVRRLARQSRPADIRSRGIPDERKRIDARDIREVLAYRRLGLLPDPQPEP